MRIAILAAAAALGLATSPVAAREVTVRVTYADLDLSKPADLAKLKDRLAVRIRDACTPSQGWFSRTADADRACQSEAMQAAMAKVAEARDSANSAQMAIAK